MEDAAFSFMRIFTIQAAASLLDHTPCTYYTTKYNSTRYFSTLRAQSLEISKRQKGITH